MVETAHRRATWLLAIVVPVTAAATLALVIAATAAADVGGARRGSATERTVRLAESSSTRTGIDVEALLPGRTARHCLVVQGDNDVRAGVVTVRGTSSGALVRYLDLSVQRGAIGATCADPGPLTGIYAGPLAGFGGESALTSTGHPLPAGGEMVPYVIEVSLDARTPNDAQGRSARLDLLWEVRGGAAPR